MACKCTKAFSVTVFADFNTEEGRLTRDYFFDRAMAYDEVDISTDGEGRQEMLKLSEQNTRPVIVIDGEVFVGFDAAALDVALPG